MCLDPANVVEDMGEQVVNGEEPAVNVETPPPSLTSSSDEDEEDYQPRHDHDGVIRRLVESFAQVTEFTNTPDRVVMDRTYVMGHTVVCRYHVGENGRRTIRSMLSERQDLADLAVFRGTTCPPVIVANLGRGTPIHVEESVFGSFNTYHTRGN